MKDAGARLERLWGILEPTEPWLKPATIRWRLYASTALMLRLLAIMEWSHFG